jgi:hypothetical protein
MLIQVKKNALLNLISFILLIFFSLFLSSMPQYINGQGLGSCDVPYENRQYGITMYYPSDFLSTGADLSQSNAWIASFTNQYGAGTAFVDVRATTDTLEDYSIKRHLSDLSLHPGAVDELEPSLVSFANNDAVQYEYTYTTSNRELWTSYVILMKHPVYDQIYEFNFLAPVSNFNVFLDAIRCMTDSFQVQ